MHASCKMGFQSNCGEKSYDRKAGKVKTCLSPQEKQKKKLGSILNLEESEDDSHPQAVNEAQKSKGFHHKQRVEMKSCQTEEVVRYMSCLPSYLERGVKSQEQPFNLGVLDWSLLERWQNSNGDGFGINAGNLPFTSSNSTLCISFDTLQKREASTSNEQFPFTNLDFTARRRTIVPKSMNDPGNRHFAECNRYVSSEGHKSGSHTIPQNASVSPTRRKNLEKKSVSEARNLAKHESTQMGVDKSEAKVRNPSPTRRFTFGMSRIGKSSNSNSLELPKQIVENLPDSKVTSTSPCSNNVTAGKSNTSSRSRSSPLRRLLDPLLKPKGVESRDKSMKSSSGQIESPPLMSVKESVDSDGFKKESSTQALLQVALKNGVPLFTFTVDRCRDILAATVKEISSKEHSGGWIYSFFSVNNMKKKHGLASNIVAVMKVYDSSGERHDRSGRREFVLSAVSSQEADQTADPFPCNELAAVIIKYQEKNDPFTTTVILPGGHHGVPSKGEPSPLIRRWKEGGSCDCGGWDLGCQLRILASNSHSIQRGNSVKSQSTPLNLYSEEEPERPLFALSSFEDGMFSIEFDSSLKLIQAFAVAVAVMHGRTSVFLSSVAGGKQSDKTAKIMKKTAVDVVAAKYASNPPLSPAGRV